MKERFWASKQLKNNFCHFEKATRLSGAPSFVFLILENFISKKNPLECENLYKTKDILK